MARTVTRPIAGLGHSTIDPAGPMTPPLPPTIPRMRVVDAVQPKDVLEAPSTVRRPEHRPFAIVAQRLVAAGQRPQVRVEVIGRRGVRLHDRPFRRDLTHLHRVETRACARCGPDIDPLPVDI